MILCKCSESFVSFPQNTCYFQSQFYVCTLFRARILCHCEKTHSYIRTLPIKYISACIFSRPTGFARGCSTNTIVTNLFGPFLPQPPKRLQLAQNDCKQTMLNMLYPYYFKNKQKNNFLLNMRGAGSMYYQLCENLCQGLARVDNVAKVRFTFCGNPCFVI